MSIIKSLSLYTFASFFNKGLAILLLPILTVYLTPEDYGIANLFSISVLLGQYIIDFGTSSVLNVEYFKSSERAFKIKFSKTIFSVALLGFSLLIPIYIFSNEVREFTGISNNLIYVIPISSFGAYLISAYLTLLRNQSRSFNFIGVSIGRTIFEILLVFLLVVSIGMNWEGRILSRVISSLLFVCLIISLLSQESLLKSIPNRVEVTSILGSASPFILNGFTSYILNNSNRFYISYFLDSKATIGLFSVAVSIGSLLLVLINSIYTAIIPNILRLLNDTQPRNVEITSIIFYYSIFLACSSMCAYILAPIAYTLFIGEAFKNGINFVGFILVGYIFWGITVMFREILVFHNRKKTVLRNSLITISSTILLNLIMVWMFDLSGILLAFVGSYAVSLVINVISAYRVYKFPIRKISSPRKVLTYLSH